MKKYLYIALLISLSFACGFQLPADTQEATTYAVSNTTHYIGKSPVAIEITGNVNIRDLYDVRTGGVLKTGTIVLGVCDGEWCFISGTELKVWRGCTNKPAGYGCEAE